MTQIMSVIIISVSVITHSEPDILECKVKWALGSITTNKASGGDGTPVELFQILKDDCGSDHELIIAKFRLKLKKVGKTTRPFRYDLNQIPYDYTVEVRNRFKGLDLIECLMNYGQRFVTLYRRQGSRPFP